MSELRFGRGAVHDAAAAALAESKALGHQFEAETRLTLEFDAFRSRLDAIDARFDAVEQRLGDLEEPR
jgi:hypothetical protein